MTVGSRIALALLAIFLLIAFGHGVDQSLADLAYDTASGTWLVDHRPGWLRALFYDGPKLALVLVGLFLLAAILWPRMPGMHLVPRRPLRFLFLCMALVPATTGAIKSASGVSCPYAISRYGGGMPAENAEVSLQGFIDHGRRDGCWPSGHVSGAFALLGLLLLPGMQRPWLAVAILLEGFSMGAYQVLRGAHYASHIVVSLCIAIVVISALQRLMLDPLVKRTTRSRPRDPVQNSIRMPVAGSSGNQ